MVIDLGVTVVIWVNQDLRRQTRPVARAEQIGSNNASTSLLKLIARRLSSSLLAHLSGSATYVQICYSNQLESSILLTVPSTLQDSEFHSYIVAVPVVSLNQILSSTSSLFPRQFVQFDSRVAGFVSFPVSIRFLSSALLAVLSTVRDSLAITLLATSGFCSTVVAAHVSVRIFN